MAFTRAKATQYQTLAQSPPVVDEAYRLSGLKPEGSITVAAYIEAYAADGLDLVTADDDIMYPQGWLAALIAARRAHPGEFVGYRAKRVLLDVAGELAPYAEWPSADVGESGPRVFLTGGAGVVFPQRLIGQMHEAGDSFTETCPRADDIWINVQALRAGVVTRRVPCRGFALSFPRSQGEGALHTDNVGRGGNDRQLAATLTPGDLDVLNAG